MPILYFDDGFKGFYPTQVEFMLDHAELYENKEFSSWMVKMLGRPKHPIYNINNGLLKITADHPLFIKKADGKVGIGAVNVDRCKKSISFKQEVLSIENEDYLYLKEGEWIKVESIVPSNDYVQTYNILSFSGTKTYFANGILVYEEHPPDCFTNDHLENLLEKYPEITKFLFSLPIFQRIFKSN